MVEYKDYQITRGKNNRIIVTNKYTTMIEVIFYTNGRVLTDKEVFKKIDIMLANKE